ncbi:sulfotransferase family 2 domain-containing protein [Aliifodinibius salipaludis]|uniref:sulfotransferase family 2 domain-containing protein n=1 Tax=Fodinibius salipaludis TaxID=2032627 RepID=UPI0020D12F97|nr:sulfotransferase family 2 domain-containing protein [Aliifodinibius salipaludis]
MLISEKHKYIFISIPKTGTTAIQSFLQENDDSSVLNWITIKAKRIKIDEYVKTWKLMKIMGDEYDKYTVFTFIRDPYARSVSGYHFYKNGNTLRSHYFIRNFMAQLNVLITKILPFIMWSILKPNKKLVDYFFDKNGQELIDLVGKTENMNKDLSSICNLLGIPLENVSVPVKNSSRHSTVENFFTNKWHEKLYRKKS